MFERILELWRKLCIAANSRSCRNNLNDDIVSVAQNHVVVESNQIQSFFSRNTLCWVSFSHRSISSSFIQRWAIIMANLRHTFRCHHRHHHVPSSDYRSPQTSVSNASLDLDLNLRHTVLHGSVFAKPILISNTCMEYTYVPITAYTTLCPECLFLVWPYLQYCV